ncbi:MAG: hypothetical protein ACFFCW_18115 [Candidatus Hodarchaeota archaeon]
MVNMRLSQLQEWILTFAYRKIIKGHLPGSWRRTRAEIDEGGGPGDWRKSYLFKEEILLNYFGLSRSKQIPRNSEERLESTNKHRAALVTLSRTLWSLKDRGLIEMEWGTEREWTGIKLTDLGKQMAVNISNEC